MNDRSKTIINNSSTITYGSVGAGAAVGAGASVVQQGTLPPELLATVNAGLHTSRSPSPSSPIPRSSISGASISSPPTSSASRRRSTRPRQEFKSAASSLWTRVNMVGDGVHSVSRLADGIVGLAKAFGWTIAL